MQTGELVWQTCSWLCRCRVLMTLLGLCRSSFDFAVCVYDDVGVILSTWHSRWPGSMPKTALAEELAGWLEYPEDER